MSTLVLQQYKFSGVPDGNLYALVFDPTGNKAFKFGSGVYTFVTYAVSSHSDYVIALAEHTQRSKYWFVNIDSSIITLPLTSDFQQYAVEIWAEASPGVQDRSTDTLVSAYNFAWNPDRDKWEVHCNMAFDAELTRIGLVIWAEKNGEVVTDAQGVAVVIKKSDDTTLYSGTDLVAGSEGQYILSQTAITLNPDETYFGSVTVTDADGVDHTSGVAFITWD